MKLMRFTRDEVESKACYIAKNVKSNEREFNILGAFYKDFSISIIIEDSLSLEKTAFLSMDVSKEKNLFKLDNQIIINHNVIDKLDSDFNGIIKELAHMKLNKIKLNSSATFVLTLKLEHFEIMVHFLEELKNNQI